MSEPIEVTIGDDGHLRLGEEHGGLRLHVVGESTDSPLGPVCVRCNKYGPLNEAHKCLGNIAVYLKGTK